MEQSLLSGLPKEVRLTILEELINPNTLRDGRWYDHPGLRICRQLRDETLTALYRVRPLSIELPDFVPHTLKRSEWPSTVYMQGGSRLFKTKRFEPMFMRSGIFGSDKDLHILRKFPFHLFPSVQITVRPPDREDYAQFVMTWNRLR
jgi:hypothetical protein